MRVRNESFPTSKKFDDAVNLDLSAWCRFSFGLPFAIENDARMALLGEAAFGAAKGSCDAVMITLGSGIGPGQRSSTANCSAASTVGPVLSVFTRPVGCTRGEDCGGMR